MRVGLGNTICVKRYYFPQKKYFEIPNSFLLVSIPSTHIPHAVAAFRIPFQDLALLSRSYRNIKKRLSMFDAFLSGYRFLGWLGNYQIG
jgi:hypothetical protein